MKQVLIALDQLLNTLLGGWADETLSCRAYRRARVSRFWKVIMSLIDDLFFWQDQHCRQCYYYEKEHFDLPVELR